MKSITFTHTINNEAFKFECEYLIAEDSEGMIEVHELSINPIFSPGQNTLALDDPDIRMEVTDHAYNLIMQKESASCI